MHWKDWCWSWNSSTLATSCEELTHWKKPWEGFGAGVEGDDRGWDGWMSSLTRWTWVWVNFRSWWWTGRPGVLWFMGSQRVGRDWTQLNIIFLPPSGPRPPGPAQPLSCSLERGLRNESNSEPQLIKPREQIGEPNSWHLPLPCRVGRSWSPHSHPFPASLSIPYSPGQNLHCLKSVPRDQD